LDVRWLLIWDWYSGLNLDLELQPMADSASLVAIARRIAKWELMSEPMHSRVKISYDLPA
jgi:hypothetical protein